MSWLDLLTAHLLAFALVGIFWVHRVVHPESYLFTLPLVYGIHKSFRLASLFARAVTIIVFSFLAAMLLSADVVVYANILAALYVVWPAFLHPDQLEEYAQRRKWLAYSVFVLYIGFAFAFSLAGVEIRNLALPQARAHFASLTQPGEAFGVVWWTLVGLGLGGCVRVLARWLMRERHLPD